MPLVVPVPAPAPIKPTPDPRIPKAMAVIDKALKDSRVGTTSRDYFKKTKYEMQSPLADAA